MIFYLPSQPAALYIYFIYRLSSRTLIWFILWRMAGSFNMKYGAVIKTLTWNIYDMSLYVNQNPDYIFLHLDSEHNIIQMHLY